VTLGTVRQLDFAAVDDLAFAAERGRLDVSKLPTSFVSHQLGPLLELYQLSISGCGPASLRGGWLDVEAFAGLGTAIRAKNARWCSPAENILGLLRTDNGVADYEWTAFAIDAKRAAVQSGLSTDWAAQMVGAMGEFRSNIHEHSEAVATGLICFRATPGLFEFVVADRGLGLLSTLRRSPEYTNLADHGEALRLALTDGASRFGFDCGRGYGFRPLFTGLANRQASLRFRTGSASLVIDGTTPTLVRAHPGRKVHLPGFHISVACRVSPAVRP
jgi:hypothetical protein